MQYIKDNEMCVCLFFFLSLPLKEVPHTICVLCLSEQEGELVKIQK